MKRRRFLLAISAILLVVVLAACRRDDPTPTPVPPTAVPEPTNTAVPAPTEEVVENIDETWARIQDAGKIIVGTSADYPPFEYYTDDQLLTGFDVALMLEIGETLGLPVEFRDMSFEALANAVVEDQIDVAISAISATVDRANFVDFSNIYFVGEDAVIMRSDVEGVVLRDVNDLAGARVGVQTQTVYEQMVQERLVDTGLTHPNNIFTYAKANEAVQALGNREVDFVLLDLQPAEVAAGTGDFVIAGSSFDPQRFAMAAPKGSPVTLANLNRALTSLQISGRLDELAKQYLDLETLPEIPDPNPPVGPETPVPPAGCVDLMRYVADVTLDDKNRTDPPVMAPGQRFEKVWRVENVGSCTWTTQYFMGFTGGNSPLARMGGQNTFLPTDVPPGAQVDIAVAMVAPLSPGNYLGLWELFNAGNQGIGDRVWVNIIVPSSATPTPLPTATPSPTVSFTADRYTINQGECTTLRWATANIQAVFLYPQGENWQNYPTVGEGAREVCPNQTTTYELRVVRTDGSVEIRQVRIDVIPSVGAPEIRRFTVDPPHQIYTGQCVIVAWEVTGAVTNVRITRSGQALKDPAPFSGSLQDCPPVGEQVYRVEASGPGGSSNAQQVLQVVESPPEPPTPTVVPPNPPAVITAFSVTPNQVAVGQCVVIYWSTAGGVTNVRILKDGSIVLDNAPFSGQTQDCPSGAGTITYSIEARNAGGEVTSQSAPVTVQDAVPENPLANTNWQLASMFVNQVPLPNSTLSAYFGADGRSSVNGGCNSFSGPYIVNGNSITIGPFAGGAALCGEEVDSQESLYVSTLQSASTYEISGNQLILYDAGGQEIMRLDQN